MFLIIRKQTRKERKTFEAFNNIWKRFGFSGGTPCGSLSLFPCLLFLFSFSTSIYYSFALFSVIYSIFMCTHCFYLRSFCSLFFLLSAYLSWPPRLEGNQSFWSFNLLIKGVSSCSSNVCKPVLSDRYRKRSGKTEIHPKPTTRLSFKKDKKKTIPTLPGLLLQQNVWTNFRVFLKSFLCSELYEV